MAQFVQDLYLLASSSTTPTPPRVGYTLIGCWDVASSGSQGTGATSGTNMMGLYARFLDISELPSAFHIGEVFVTCSGNSTQVVPAVAADQTGYQARGTWAMDGGGGVGTNGTRGNGTASLFVREATGCGSMQMYVGDVCVTASNDSFPSLPAGGGTNNYHLIGYWDVDSIGAQGTNNTSSGSYMCGLWAQYSLYTGP